MKIKTKSRIDHLEVLLRRVREASRINDRNYRVSQYLGSHDAHLHAVLEAYDAMKPEDRPDKAKLASIASNLDAWKGTDEPVLVHRIPKDSPGEYRTVLEFEIENRALQYLVRDVLIAVLELHPNQYVTRGGIHAAIRHTKQALSDGYLWAVELDIQDCYPSFDGEKLSSLLPLPKEVTDHVILSRHLNLSSGFSFVGNSPGDDQGGDAITLKAISPARRGLPQGSAASPIVAEAMVAIALKQVPTLGVIIAYADNVLLLAKTKSDRDSMTKALLAAFEAHPVGRLRLSPKTFALGEPVEFLGHRLTPCQGDVRTEISNSNKRKFENRMKSKVRSLAKTKRQRARRKALHDIQQDIQSWAAAFTLCEDTQKIRSYWLARLHWQFKEGPDSAFDEKETMSNTVYKTFKLHPDQKEIVEAALNYAKAKSGTKFDGVGLEYICQEVMGTGLSFENLEAAMNAEFKKSTGIQEFVATVSTLVEQIAGVTLTVTIGE
jgi:Reverse transcriptase (RNA-dependent DNA polymerase)